jgi:outer membrane translocation and assembly module TamA
MTKIQRGRNLGQRLKIRRRSKQNEDEDVNSHSAESVPRSKNASVHVDDDSGSSAPLQGAHQQQDDTIPQERINDNKTKRGKKRLSRKEQKTRKKLRQTATVAVDRDQAKMPHDERPPADSDGEQASE